jgi:chaperonin GroES
MKIQPLADHVLIEPIKQEEKTESGILLPETVNKEKPEQGKVIAVGPGKKNKSGERISMEIQEGQKVLFTKYGPNEIKVDGKKYLIAKESDILAIIK